MRRSLVPAVTNMIIEIVHDSQRSIITISTQIDAHGPFNRHSNALKGRPKSTVVTAVEVATRLEEASPPR